LKVEKLLRISWPKKSAAKDSAPGWKYNDNCYSLQLLRKDFIVQRFRGCLRSFPWLAASGGDAG
jgi:hypothetical protein